MCPVILSLLQTLTPLTNSNTFGQISIYTSFSMQKSGSEKQVHAKHQMLHNLIMVSQSRRSGSFNCSFGAEKDDFHLATTCFAFILQVSFTYELL